MLTPAAERVMAALRPSLLPKGTTARPALSSRRFGAEAGALDYYVTRTSGSFSICDASAPPSGVSFGFDYFVVD